MAKSKSKPQEKVADQDVQRRGESDWDYAARRAETLSNDGANSEYRDGPVPNLVQQFRGGPEPRQ